MKWAEMFFEPINLPIIGSDPNLIPDADCENCNYFVTSYIESTNQWCYMFEKSPGTKCGQFKGLSK